ncbi:MAG: hypothetical protein ACI4PK_04210 [Oscillospiraceae bacterium]
MKDNLYLAPEIKERYKPLYSGAFYKRFIEGVWCSADGLVYQNFNLLKNTTDNLPDNFSKYYISCDYGITNPMAFGLRGLHNCVWYRIAEYYYDSKKSGQRKTNEEYYNDLIKFVGNYNISAIIIDPSASSFIECIKRRRRFKVIKAKNNVISGIDLVSEALNPKKIIISKNCIREFALYEWAKNCSKDEPKKQNDHTMDEIRYFVATIVMPKQKQ